MKRLIVKCVERGVNIPVTRIEDHMGVVYAYYEDALVGCFSTEAVDMLYISDQKCGD